MCAAGLVVVMTLCELAELIDVEVARVGDVVVLEVLFQVGLTPVGVRRDGLVSRDGGGRAGHDHGEGRQVGRKLHLARRCGSRGARSAGGGGVEEASEVHRELTLLVCV